MEGNPIIHKEVQERNKYFQILDGLDGFKALPPKKQQLIKLSLYIQQRSVRGTDEGSKDNIGIGYETGDVFINFPNDSSPDGIPIDNKYRESQKHIYDWYCHATVAGIENEKVDKKLFYQTDVPRLIEETGYEIKSKSDIDDFIEIALSNQEMPAVLHVLGNTNNPVLHSAIILGRDDSGTFVVWEKKGVSIPYQLTTLEQIYKDYASHEQEWIVRPLHNLSDGIEE